MKPLTTLLIPFIAFNFTHANGPNHLDSVSKEGFHQTTSPSHHSTQNPGEPFNHGPNDINAGWRRGVTPGYYLGFRALSDEMRDLRRPSDIPVTDGFLKTLYIDFHFMNQEYNGQFFTDAVDSSAYDEPIENDLYGITLGFGLGDNPNLQVRVPISVSRFEVGELDDTGVSSGLELFPNYRINELSLIHI